MDMWDYEEFLRSKNIKVKGRGGLRQSQTRRALKNWPEITYFKNIPKYFEL